MNAGGKPSTLETLAGTAAHLRAIRFLTDERAPAVLSRLSTGAASRAHQMYTPPGTPSES